MYSTIWYGVNNNITGFAVWPNTSPVQYVSGGCGGPHCSVSFTPDSSFAMRVVSLLEPAASWYPSDKHNILLLMTTFSTFKKSLAYLLLYIIQVTKKFHLPVIFQLIPRWYHLIHNPIGKIPDLEDQLEYEPLPITYDTR